MGAGDSSKQIQYQEGCLMRSWRETGMNLGLLVLRVMAGAGMACLHSFGRLSPGHIEEFAKIAVAPLGFPFPLVFAYLSVLTEFVGGLFIAAGLLTRLTALPLIFNMCVAIVGVHMHNGDSLAKMEPALTYLTAFVTLFLAGPGSLSVDRIIWGTRK